MAAKPSAAALKRAQKQADDAYALRDRAIDAMNKSYEEQAQLHARLNDPQLVQVNRADLRALLDEIGQSYVRNIDVQQRLRAALEEVPLDPGNPRVHLARAARSKDEWLILAKPDVRRGIYYRCTIYDKDAEQPHVLRIRGGREGDDGFLRLECGKHISVRNFQRLLKIFEDGLFAREINGLPRTQRLAQSSEDE